MTDLMVEAGVAPREKFTTVYSGMEVEPFLAADELRADTRRSLGYSDQHVVVGKIARLFHLKGHEYLVRAAALAVAKNPDLRFLLVGDGVLAEPIRQQVRAAGLDDHFQFTGLVPPERIPALFGAMDIVVHTSLREGLARVLPQALIAGKPVIWYDVDGAREVVIDGETGFLLPPKAVDELAERIGRLAADPQLRAAMGAARACAIHRAVSPPAHDAPVARSVRAIARAQARTISAPIRGKLSATLARGRGSPGRQGC